MVYKERMFHEAPAKEQAANGVAALESRVADALAADHALDATGISVISHGNGVTLGGLAGSQKEIAQAEEIARRVEGVDEVVNQIALTQTGTH
ncbi:hypothetical protein BJF93_00230 [Xaviernesmea oryzae]|uniref:BON domain-containing protein n=1 Tax=Xaviernesmea oryzae TaxID=464029 RepID=A0A1Q9B0P4_9HYPH|nr:BON domain-containing protein [Xaviernesmea oryzae]OLP61533.1 hypothetical protein BJF93_00230 [Xaviernesmea oryzae]SEL70304.1 BON domain-containing protein [Xaviernesmea oryzae]